MKIMLIIKTKNPGEFRDFESVIIINPKTT